MKEIRLLYNPQVRRYSFDDYYLVESEFSKLYINKFHFGDKFLNGIPFLGN